MCSKGFHLGLIALCALVTLSAIPAKADDKSVLRELKEDIATKKQDKKSDAAQTGLSDTNGVDEEATSNYIENAHNELEARILYELIRAPFWIPMVIVNDGHEHPILWAPYPYANRYRGFASHEEKEGFRDFHLRLSTEGSWRNDNLMHAGFNMAFAASSRLELVADYKLYIDGFGAKAEKLNAANLDLNFLFAVGPHGQFRIGLGYIGLYEKATRTSGFHFTYGFDLFIHRPIVLSVLTSMGTYLNADLGSAKVRTTLGALYRNMEFFVGYDGHRIGANSISGPVAGLRLYF
ncbi:MAG: hypothetical protein QGI45_01755 [Myxococcota bacterium]|jgi:hypothetical protein|nr:hypothetical protein [Myxococcota bacterium]